MKTPTYKQLKDAEDFLVHNGKTGKEIFEEICKKAMDNVDVLSSYHHFVVFGEIKVIYKDREQQ